MRRVVAQCTAPGIGLPINRPRYVMGIGYPLDIVMCSGDLFFAGCSSCLMLSWVCPEAVHTVFLFAAMSSCHQAAIEMPHLRRPAQAEAGNL